MRWLKYATMILGFLTDRWRSSLTRVYTAILSASFVLITPCSNFRAITTNEQLCDKSNKMTMHLSTQSDQSLRCALWVAKDPSFLHLNSEAQADPRLHWVHMPFWVQLFSIFMAGFTSLSTIIITWYSRKISVRTFIVLPHLSSSEQIRRVFDDNWRIIFVSSP